MQLLWTAASTPSLHKALPTCTVSLAVVDKSHDMSSCAPRKPMHSLIPFPTLPPAISSRPLPLPPKTHALLRTHTRMTTEFDFANRSRKQSLSPLKPAVVAPSMQRRRSRDPNVADRLVVELDDDDHTHTVPPRPCSPSPEPRDQATRGKTRSDPDIPISPDHVAPPAYSTLPPPYSATTDEKKDANLFTLVVEQDDDQPSPDHKPSVVAPQPSTSTSSSSSSHKRARVSTSELRVLLYLYRTVVYGLELRNRKEKDSPTSDLKSPLERPTKKKPLGPRSSSSPVPLSSHAASLIPPPEHKLQFENALAAASAKPSRHSPAGFAQFPLVEDDLDSDKDSEDIPPRTPFHSPCQSPRSSPQPFLRPSPSLDAVASFFAASTPKPKKEKTKAEINAELHVQDALLALRLKEFLRAQGVCEDDLKVDFDDEGSLVEVENGKVLDEPEQESPVKVQQEDDEESNVLDEYFMGIEEQEHNGSAKKDRGPVVEDDDVVAQPKPDSPFVEEDDLDNSSVSSPQTTLKPPTLQVSTMAQRISSPPPTSPSPLPHAVLPTSYMVALLTMRIRHPSKKPGPSSSSNGGSGGTGSHEKGKEGKLKRKSGLSVVVEVD